MSPPELRIATRMSHLATAQATQVGMALEEAHPGLTVRLVGVDTSGDLDQVSSVTALTEMGAFVRAVQLELLEGRADVAVHSCKDLPVGNPEGLVLAAFPERAEPFDAIVGTRLSEMAPGARVGTGSPRRAAQVALLRPDVSVEEIRGNVDTRVRLATDGPLDAVVLAAAGLSRLGWEDRIAEVLTVDQMVPAPAQGALAVETRADGPARQLAEAIDHAATRAAVEAERLLLEITGAGCRSAVGALATQWLDGSVSMEAFTSDERGARRSSVVGATPRVAAELAAEELGL